MTKKSHITTKHTVENDNIENTRLFAKQMLQGRFFIGNFQEKRYVDSLQLYRDVVYICSEQNFLVHDLEVVRKRLHSCYSDHWIGITDPNTIGAPAVYAIWTELPAEVFGNYWYKIRKVKFRSNEILLKLKMVKPVNTFDLSKTLLSVENNDTNVTQRGAAASANESVVWFFKAIVTKRNVKETARFLTLLFFTIVAGIITFIENLGNFAIKLLREAANLIVVLRPIIIAFIDLIAKIIGGFYLLILSMWKTRQPPIYQSQYVPGNQPMLLGHSNTVVYHRGPINVPYSRECLNRGVKIKPLN